MRSKGGQARRSLTNDLRATAADAPEINTLTDVVAELNRLNQVVEALGAKHGFSSTWLDRKIKLLREFTFAIEKKMAQPKPPGGRVFDVPEGMTPLNPFDRASVLAFAARLGIEAGPNGVVKLGRELRAERSQEAAVDAAPLPTDAPIDSEAVVIDSDA